MSQDAFQIICNECRSTVAGENENCPSCGASLNGGERVRPTRTGGASLPDLWTAAPGPREPRGTQVQPVHPGGGRWLPLVGLLVLAAIVAAICYLVLR